MFNCTYYAFIYKGSFTEDQILEWQMYNMTLHNNPYVLTYNGNQRRPMSIAG